MARIGKWVKIYLDDNTGTPVARDITADVTEIDGLPLTYDELEASGYGMDKRYLVGQGDCSVTLTCNLTTTASVGTHTVGAAIVAQCATTKTLTVQLGNNAAPTTGDPEYEGEFYCSEYTVKPPKDGLQQCIIKLVPASTLPAWGTVSA
jgi:hypothetical protein